MKKHLLFILPLMIMACHPTPEQQVKRVMKNMSTRDKIAQLITITSDSYNPPEKRANRDSMVAVEHIGGLIIMQDRLPHSIVRMNELQSMSPIPLIVSIDGEWGPSMRYGEFPFYPRHMQLGALTDDSLVYKMGLAVAKECKMLNILINFAPVVDINVNPNNPVINTRSFGENKERVTRLADAYMKGMQDGGIYACAKHFPGHGDTDVDSHKALPLLPFTRERLDSLELYPFRKLMDDDVAFVMVGHLNIPVIDTTVSTLSYKLVTEMLKHEMGYQGIVVTDALNMKGVSDNLSPADVTLAAYKAGVDMLLMPDDVPEALDKIEAAVNSGECSMEDLNERVRKILLLKARAGMFEKGYSAIIDTTHIVEDTALPEHRALVQELCDKSITLVDNPANMLPLKAGQRIAYIAYNAEFQPMLRKYGEQEGLSGYCPQSGIQPNATLLYQHLSAQIPDIDYIPLSKQAGKKEIMRIARQMAGYDCILFVCHDPVGRPKDNLIAEEHLQDIEKIIQAKPTLLIHYGTPYGMNNMPWLHELGAIIIGYADSEANQTATAKILTGEIPAQGILPVSAGGYKAL